MLHATQEDLINLNHSIIMYSCKLQALKYNIHVLSSVQNPNKHWTDMHYIDQLDALLQTKV